MPSKALRNPRSARARIDRSTAIAIAFARFESRRSRDCELCARGCARLAAHCCGATLALGHSVLTTRVLLPVVVLAIHPNRPAKTYQAPSPPSVEPQLSICKNPPCIDGHNPPPKPSEFHTTILRIDHKRWNQNPLGPGCKNDDLVRFQIPTGSELYSITIGENGCSPDDPDTSVGHYVDTHVGLGIVAGGTVLNRRPPAGATGAQELSYHWWFNQWGHSQASICINVKSKKPLSLDPTKTNRFVHINMDDGWVKHRVKLPACFREFDVAVDLQGPIDGRDISYKDVHVGGQVTNGDNCVIEWFGCRDDKNVIP